MDTLSAAAELMQAQYRGYLYLIIAIGFVGVIMLAAGWFLWYDIWGRYPVIMLTGGGGNGTNRRGRVHRNSDRLV